MIATPTQQPPAALPRLGDDTNVILLQIAVPDVLAESLPACYHAENYSGAIYLREAITARLAAASNNVSAIGPLNRLTLYIVCEGTPAVEAMNTIYDVVSQAFTLESFAVITRYCGAEGFFREYWRGSLAGDIRAMTTMETLRQDVEAACAAQAAMAAKMNTTLLHFKVLLANQPQPPQS